MRRLGGLSSAGLSRFAKAAVVCLIAFPLLFCGCGVEGGNPAEEPANTPAVESPEPEKPVDLTITCVGDVMVHRSQIDCQYNSQLGRFDYTNNYKWIKPYIEGADLALCNVETTFAGKPYSGYPNFSAPDELAAALVDTGFDVAITSNNHMMDKGGAGLLRTVEVLRNAGMQVVGSRREPAEKRYVINEVKGLKVATVAYTYETGDGQTTALNGATISPQNAELINSFSYNTLDSDLAQVKAQVDSARKEGADIVIVYYHWGEEYQLAANKWQREMARRTADEMDVDMIFASHPHVLQEMEYLTKKGTDRKIPVFYSMGNLISNQRTETLNNRYTETGIMATVTLSYMASEKKVTAVTMSAVPTWVDKFTKGGKLTYEIIPLDQNLSGNATLAQSGHLARAQRALEDAHGILKFN